MKKSIWLTAIGMLVLVAAGVYSAMHGPLPHALLTSADVPASAVSDGAEDTVFRTYRDGEDLYVLYQHDERNAYVDISMEAHRKFSKPVVTATIRHAHNEAPDMGIGVLKLPGLAGERVALKIRDER